ncbi:MAG TPA: magnesium/cobalt transporter CorA [Acidimicrobiales bacterium]|nr:magnesium/cobalt transporter CorA [Acidimicrobiales bacterium]
MNTRLLHVSDDGQRVEHPGEHLDDLVGGWYWLDVLDPSEDHAHDLARRFSLDRVTRDDILEREFPKFEDLDHYQLYVVHALAADPISVRTAEVDVLVGDSWVVTIHPEPIPSIDELFDRMGRESFQVDGPFHLAARLFEFIGERYLPILDDVDAQILDLEEGAIDGDASVLPDIHALRRDIAVLRRSLAPQRRMLELLCRNVERADRASRDVSDALDHHVRMIDSLDSAHQMITTLVDSYRSANAEQMNEVMKVLTVFSAIFLPLTLIAGIYGMNFHNMPELDERWAYPGSIAAMLVVAAGLWLYFVRRGFIGGPKLHRFARPARTAGRVGRGLASAAVLPVRVVTRRNSNGSDPSADDPTAPGTPGG